MPTPAEDAQLKIWNAALRNAQSGSLNSLTENSNEGDACEELWDPIFQALLDEFEWPFASARAELTKDATGPLGDSWQTQFSVPSDFRRPLKIDTTDVGPYRWEGRKILANYDGKIVLVYIRVADLTETSATFNLLAQRRLAADLAVNLKERSRQLQIDLAIRAERMIPRALAECAQYAGRQALTYQTPKGY